MEEIEVKKEKANLRKVWSNAFLDELDRLLEMCFLKQKNKKEQFITKDKMEVKLIRLLQSQKKFTQKDTFKNNLSTQAMYDTITSSIAKIHTINLQTKQVEGITVFEKFIVRDFSDVMFFDVYSMECLYYFEKQKLVFDSFSYKDTFRFLTHTEEDAPKKRTDYYCTPTPAKNLIVPTVRAKNE